MTYDYIDIHSHLHDKEFDGDREAVLARMREQKTATIAVGTHLESSRAAVALANKESDVWATVGVHPTDTKALLLPHEFETLAREHRVVAIGECGLDYYRGGLSEEEKLRQRNIFEAQIELALAVDKPLMIHGRPTKGTMDAYHDILDILYRYQKEAGERLRGNIHFFSGDAAIAHKFIELGFTLSFPGVLTFTHDYDESVRAVPLERIMAETDSPYAAPVPFRGKRNDPTHVKEVAAAIARIRGEEEGKVREALVANALSAFRLR
ncbi:TatD family hydrolase [Candidatus Parcubacteria bacterium]|nr:TatD family hydrolase [Candidatus Parcubacteria bacterium]